MKRKVLGIVNALLASAFAIAFLNSLVWTILALPSLKTLQDLYPLVFILFFLLMSVVNGYLAFILLRRSKFKLPFTYFCIATLASPVWIFSVFIGYDFSPVLALIIAFAFVIILFYFITKSSLKFALLFATVSLAVLIPMLLNGFEEGYCVQKGNAADRTGSKMVNATKQDDILLKKYGVFYGGQIGVNFRAHMLCHSSFNFFNAILNK